MTGPVATGRRGFMAGMAGVAGMTVVPAAAAARSATAGAPVNLAPVARPTSGHVSGDTRLTALNSGKDPANSGDTTNGMFGTWPATDTQTIEYTWDVPITTDHVDVYWWVDGQGIGLPKAWHVEYWDGKRFQRTRSPAAPDVLRDRYNAVRFEPVTTERLRLVVQGDGKLSIGALQWRVWSKGAPPVFAPAVVAGVDRSVVLGGATYLQGKATWLQRGATDPLGWQTVSGPGAVTFADPRAAATTARFSAAGDYVLRLAASASGKAAASTLTVRVQAPPPERRLDVVYTTPYSIDSPLWSARAKQLIVNWIPHCVAYCERTDLPIGQGGLDNFIEAGKALRGEPHDKHKGYVFANAWVHQTIESICIALMVDAQGDAEILAAQKAMRATLEKWIPIVLAAQEPDGYLQTAYTLADRQQWPTRWNPGNRADHEGYVAGYFIESAINHHTLTGGKDLRLYDAAKKLADCWVANIGPGKMAWFDGHQEMEQALVRFGRFVNDVEGQGRGDAYIALARFLLDSRRGGSEYDQSHLPPTQQYEAVGHAVRAVYFYSGMADIAAESRDTDYQSAVLSLWDNMVNRKYYVTGGVGSGDTSEGFGGDYALRNDAYCESCSSCGLIFFQYKLNIAYHDAKYADLYEETMYNALLGSVDLPARNFCYTNPLVDTERTAWHVCPCCVGNIPRTLLMLPTWSYAKAPNAVFVNMFVGSTVNVGEVAGTTVEMVQKTDYPWDGAVGITVNPAQPRRFAVHVRVPDRKTSELYTSVPAVRGIGGLTVNGTPVAVRIERGYAVIERDWTAGDRIDFVVPLAVQRVVASDRIDATRGKVALRYGPMIYNVERADQARIDRKLSGAPVKPVWRSDLLGGVMAIEGKWDDGSPMVAIPNYARMNRVGVTATFGGTDGGVNYNPSGAGEAVGDAPARRDVQGRHSQVWLNV
ncbi:Tat pathway signal protein [Sphingomonas sp. Leaf412]|nr:Tat pathway signal protein [Sphingomonas sp. Leaf412]